MKYLCKVIRSYDKFKKGEEVILSPSDLMMWKQFVMVLKKIKEKPDMVIK